MIRVGKHTEAKSVNIFHQFNDSIYLLWMLYYFTYVFKQF